MYRILYFSLPMRSCNRAKHQPERLATVIVAVMMATLSAVVHRPADHEFLLAEGCTPRRAHRSPLGRACYVRTSLPRRTRAILGSSAHSWHMQLAFPRLISTRQDMLGQSI